MPAGKCLLCSVSHHVTSVSCMFRFERWLIEQVIEAVEAAMMDFLDKKASRLPRRLLEDALRTAPAAAPTLLPLPLGRAATASTAFRRTEALALLGTMLKLSNVRQSGCGLELWHDPGCYNGTMGVAVHSVSSCAILQFCQEHGRPIDFSCM